MNCPRCQQTLNDDAQYCSSCGLSIAPFTSQTELLDPSVVKSESDPLLGRILDGKYELVELLGEGGMGAVYRARRLHIGDEVAVKLLRSAIVLEPESIERFRREARSAAAIHHPNVLTIHDFGELRANGAPAYIVMELVRGKSVRDLLTEEGHLPLERAVSIMLDVCAGVGYAHRAGLIHRDLKPDNIIVTPPRFDGDRETAKVVDFGVAKLNDSANEMRVTQTGVVVGSPFYMSPEQCRGERLDPRTDVYSLGVVFHEMLAGAPPFNATTLAGLITKHLTEPPPAFSSDLKIPSGIETVCRRALSKESSERQSDASEFGRELRAAFNGQDRQGRETAAVEQRSTIAIAPADYSTNPMPAQRPVPAARSFKRAALIGIAAIAFIALFLGIAGIAAYKFVQNSGKSTPGEEQGNTSVTPAQNRENSPEEEKSPSVDDRPFTGSLVGNWNGSYGPAGSPATLHIDFSDDKKFSGTLEQNGVTVALTGAIDQKTRNVSITETKILKGSGWSLGSDTGSVTSDGKTMSGTGKDKIGGQYGIEYEWSFTR